MIKATISSYSVHPNNSLKQKIDKFIEIEKKDQLSMDNFIDELASLNILDKLDKGSNIDPNNNYELFAQLIKHAKEKHILRVKVRYQKKKHKRSKCLTNGITNYFILTNMGLGQATQQNLLR